MIDTLKAILRSMGQGLLHQDAGELVYAYCEVDAVQGRLTELKPEGLMLIVDGCETVDQAQALLQNVARWSKRK